MTDFAYVGRGLYSVTEASRIADVPAQRIRRWIRGYTFRDRTGQTRESAPVVRRNLEDPSPSIDTLFFADLIEVRFVNILRNLHIGWPTIRAAAIEAARELGEHPFASQRLLTDGAEVFVRTKDALLMNIVTKQYAWQRILERFLRDLDFNEQDQARLWWPLGRRRRVVIDPARAFGSPIVLERVPTWVLAAAARAEGSSAKAAWAYEVAASSVRDAVLFERKHGLRRAA